MAGAAGVVTGVLGVKGVRFQGLQLYWGAPDEPSRTRKSAQCRILLLTDDQVFFSCRKQIPLDGAASVPAVSAGRHHLIMRML